MNNGDVLTRCAARPFQDGCGRLHFPEFKGAIIQLLEELDMVAPSDEQMLQLFHKHEDQAGGIAFEGYRAFLFRFICFLASSGEAHAAALAPPRVSGSPRKERQRSWRRHYLMTSQRKVDEVYRFGKQLGKGNYGVVHQVAYRGVLAQMSLKPRVCKVVNKNWSDHYKNAIERSREEIAVMKKLDHPSIVRIFEDFEDEQNFYMVMEECRGGDLKDAVANPCGESVVKWELWVARVFQQVLSALGFCHALGIMHKDLKPENVLLLSKKGAPILETHAVIVDFGFVEYFVSSGERGRERTGTPPFMAPEVWAGSFTPACDVWSCGVMLYFMFSGQLPFVSRNMDEYPTLLASDPSWSKVGGASWEAQNIVRSMLRRVETSRPGAYELLSHQWFRSCAVKSMARYDTCAHRLVKLLIRARKRSRFEAFVARLTATQLDAALQTVANEMFRTLDLDRDGMLSVEDLQHAIKVGGTMAEEAGIPLQDLLAGDSAGISYTGFLACFVDFRGRSPQEVDRLFWIAWQQFQPNENGCVRIADMQQALVNRGMAVSELPATFLDMLKHGSRGFLNLDTFKSLFDSSRGAVKQ